MTPAAFVTDATPMLRRCTWDEPDGLWEEPFPHWEDDDLSHRAAGAGPRLQSVSSSNPALGACFIQGNGGWQASRPYPLKRTMITVCREAGRRGAGQVAGRGPLTLARFVEHECLREGEHGRLQPQIALIRGLRETIRKPFLGRQIKGTCFADAHTERVLR